MTPMMQAAVRLGGAEWRGRGNTLHRVYLNRWAELVGLSVDRYRTMSGVAIRGGQVDGRQITPQAVRAILNVKAYVDASGLHVASFIGDGSMYEDRLVERLDHLLKSEMARLS